MHRYSWDDLKFVLAVADTGTISAAARLLGVNHATVLRRIANFEEEHGTPVFERKSHGYSLLDDKAGVIEAAREAQEAIFSVAQRMQGRADAIAGVVRLSSTDTFCQAVLPEFVKLMTEVNPELEIELLCSNDYADLARLEADIAVRPALKLPEVLRGEAAGFLGFGVYARPDMAAEETRWLGLQGALKRSTAARWLAEETAGRPNVFGAQADSFLVLRALALQGLGQALLPCCLGDEVSGLVRRHGPLEGARVPIWVLTHKDRRMTPRLREVQRRLCAFLRAKSLRLSGEDIAD